MPRVPSLLLLLILLCLLPPAGARETEHGDVALPTYLPSWAGEHPLRFVEQCLEEHDFVGAREAMGRILADLEKTCALLPPLRPVSQRQAVDSNEQLLRRWFDSLGAASRELHVSTLEVTLPIPPGSPLLWHPRLAQRAQSCFELAVARGQLDDALRLLESPNRPQVDENLERWIQNHGVADPTPDSSPWFTSRPSASSQPHALPLRLRRAYSPVTLDFPPARANTNADTDRYGRRGPLAAIYPLISDQHVLVTTGLKALVLSHRGEPGMVLHQPFAGAEHGTLMHLPVQPAVSGQYLFARARNHVREPEELDLFAYTFPDRKPQPLFNRPALFRMETSPTLAFDRVGQALEKALEGYNVVGAGVFLDGRLYIPLCRGWRKARLSVACYDLDTERVVWHRSIGSLRIRHHRATDFSGLLLETHLVAYGGDLIAVHSGGWLARIARNTGELRGVLFYPRHTPFEEATASNDSFNRFLRLPPLRMRYPGPTIRVPRRDQHGPLLVLLPPDARQVIAVDMEKWRIHWRHENAELQMLVLGKHRDQLLLLDVTTSAHDSSLELRRLDLDTGRLTNRPQFLELSVRVPEIPHVQVPGTEPVLSGVPRLVGDQLWVPTLDALEVWNLDGGAKIRRADRIVRWPHGSHGGTPIPLPGGRIATVSRGDMELGTASTLEIFEGSD